MERKLNIALRNCFFLVFFFFFSSHIIENFVYISYINMKECHDNYDFAVFEISQAFDLFDKGLYGDASRKVGYANEAAFLCRKSGVPQFAERNNKVEKFTYDIMLLLYPIPPK